MARTQLPALPLALVLVVLTGGVRPAPGVAQVTARSATAPAATTSVDLLDIALEDVLAVLARHERLGLSVSPAAAETLASLRPRVTVQTDGVVPLALMRELAARHGLDVVEHPDEPDTVALVCASELLARTAGAVAALGGGGDPARLEP